LVFSEELARKLEPKNILYLECAWIGSTEHAVVNQLSLVACGNKRLFEHCKPLFEAACGKCTFLSEELGRAQIVKAAVEIADGVALAGLVEAAYFAQQNGVDLDGLLPFWEQIGYGNSITVAKVRQVCLFFASLK
jgi:3-hydroxyisobutyrate dehydrogenase-like beta-hydroxyacid dehydrogenase